MKSYLWQMLKVAATLLLGCLFFWLHPHFLRIHPSSPGLRALLNNSQRRNLEVPSDPLMFCTSRDPKGPRLTPSHGMVRSAVPSRTLSWGCTCPSPNHQAQPLTTPLASDLNSGTFPIAAKPLTLITPRWTLPLSAPATCQRRIFVPILFVFSP